MESVDMELSRLRSELADTQDHLDHYRIDLHFREQEVQKKSDEIEHLSGKVFNSWKIQISIQWSLCCKTSRSARKIRSDL